jgi:hypothetical protein
MYPISKLHSQKKSALLVNPAPRIVTRCKLIKKRFYLELYKFEEIQKGKKQHFQKNKIM